jgi:hypothetical protein
LAKGLIGPFLGIRFVRRCNVTRPRPSLQLCAVVPSDTHLYAAAPTIERLIRRRIGNGVLSANVFGDALANLHRIGRQPWQKSFTSTGFGDAAQDLTIDVRFLLIEEAKRINCDVGSRDIL